MIRLSKIVNEGEEPKKFSNEVKKHFLEIVSTYNKYQEMMDRKSDIAEIAEILGGITEAAKQLAINETDGWFDAQTVKRNMSELDKLGNQFDKVAVEAKNLDQRLHGLYEDMGHILSRYYKIGEITEEEMKNRLGMNEASPCWDGYKQVGMKMKDGKEVPNCVPTSESVNESNDCGCNSVNEDFKAVVGKTIFSDGKGKLFFGYYKEDDSVHFVDYNTWKKLTMKDVSKGDTNKDKVINAILRAQKQFNKKVDYNMWAKKTNPSFEEKMDWFIQNRWISNINKGGIKESIQSINEGIKHFIHVETPTQIVSKPIAAQILALAKKGVRSNEIGLNMHFFGNQQAAVDAFQKVKNKIYFSLHKTDEATHGYSDSKASYIDKHKDEYKTAEKMNKGNEQSFYDSLSALEEKLGHPKYMIFLSNALRGYKVDMYKDPKIKNQQEAEEALFLLSK